ncbi:MAG: Maf family protein [Marinifilaceae bacterium]|jgi:septum formation protein|nr:Maf family protein [Marinifilaceae bacterium]
MGDKKLILGSQSPRRQELLKDLGFDFELKLKEVDESYPLNTPIDEVAEYIANKKSLAYLEELEDNEIVICADTVVCCDSEVLGKPRSIEEASYMLRKLSNKWHKVISGVSIRSKEKHKCFSGVTEVHFKKLEEEEIEFYINKYKPFDKAGSYGIQEWIGYIGIDSIRGSYFNVMGLPTYLLYKELKEF